MPVSCALHHFFPIFQPDRSLPSMTSDARAALFKRADEICRAASTRTKSARDVAHKALRSDLKNKIVNAQEARREQAEVRCPFIGKCPVPMA
jgi:hypothetical protein